MAPTPQEPAVVREDSARAHKVDGHRVVISGMSGLYPESHNVKELEQILYDKKNPVTDESCRWQFNHPEVSNYTGKVPDLHHFDAQFFKVHYRLATSMDSMARKVLEQAYQAIYDAGESPEHLYGKKVGVYIGSCFSETEKACFYVASSRTGFGIAGCNKSMFANRISYWLNAKGPSMSIDDACCSSMVALEQAYSAIERGECEAAIVGGANLCLHPQSSVHYGRTVNICSDGKTKSFDQNADGLAKSEAINVLFLQRAENAKRIYAEVMHVKTEFRQILDGETGPKYGFYRDPIDMAKFISNFYKEANVSPQSVEYVEAFGSAVPEADKAELEALDIVYCKDRTTPLLVGSVMSNIGYGEAASGISGITKVLLGYHRGSLAGNLHCSAPRQDVAALRAGRLQLLTDHRRFARALTAVNAISVTGVNAHVLLNGHYKPKDLNRYKCSYPRLVTISGRQDSAVKKVIDDLKSRPIDPEELALFHNIHQTSISGHLGRGYAILDTNEEGKTVALAETANYFDDAAHPLWFVYSGMGSQWPGMGKELMRIPIFAAAIERCRKVLEPKGVDIIHIITSPDKTIFDNILNSFVGIAAVQIGLTDILTSLGIVPDKIIGHSVGELGCAYADGCFTAEEMILSAYSRGLVSVQTPFIRGSMAAVGVGYEKISKLVPPEIEVACHNGPESSTISGPADIMKQFVAQLTAQGIFAKEVPCSNIAYHSRYIAEAGPGLLKYLSEVIKTPKKRTDRWVSTSVPQDKWNEPEAQTSSAYYHTNNLLSSVLFEETSRLIPPNAVLVEIAPHGLLQAILKRSLPESCKNIPLTRRGHKDNAFMVLDAIGKLYMEGYNPKVQNIYPQAEFPVSTGTPMLGHLVEWAHHERWTLPLYVSAHRKMAAARNFVISVHDTENRYLRGHVIRGKNVYPFAGALVAVWDTLAMSLNVPVKSTCVEFRDLKLWAQPTLLERRPLRLNVALHRANGRFEVLDEDRLIVTGIIQPQLQESARDFTREFDTKNDLDLTTVDVYKMFFERDYFYRDDFRSIHKANATLTEAQIIWDDNWVTFLDGVMQLTALREKYDSVTKIHRIRKLCIDLKEQFDNKFSAVDGKKVATAHVFEELNYVRCGGVIVENVQFRKLPIPEEDPISLKTMKFVPRFQRNSDVPTALQVYLQTVAENVNKDTINVLGVLNKKEDLTLYNEITNVLKEVPGVTVQYEQVRRENVLLMRDHFLSEVDLVLVQDLSSDDSLCQILYRVLRRDTFIINGEETIEDRVRPSALYRVISAHISKNIKLDLIKWRPTQVIAASTVVTVRNASELSLLTSTRTDLPERHKLIVLTTYPTIPGLKELVTKWRKESDRNQIYLIAVSENDNLDQLPELDLAFNVLQDSEWGGEYVTSCQERVNVGRGVTLRSSRIGDLDSLHWVEAGEPTGPGIPVNVHYTAVSDLDVKKASGVVPFRYDKEYSYCMDFSGVTDKGDRVMGLLLSDAATGRVKARPELIWPVPDHWTLEDAATVPSAFAHAFYCLDMKVQFKRGYRVLVHGAAGALGQAVLSVALAHGCEIFATVSDVRKKRFLMKMFPEIKADHIGNSRDPSFGDMVRAVTKDEGCNVVISCVKGENKYVSLNSLSPCGIMLDLVQIPNQDEYSLGMFYLTKERSYKAIDFSSMLATENVKDMKRIQVLLSEGIARGYVRPLSRVTYPAAQAPQAFRMLAGSRHRGRVLLRLRDQVTVAEPRIHCSPDLCQVVLCGGNTFGLHLTERLISRGAKKLHMHCVQPSKYFELKVQEWERRGIKVQVSTEDLSNNKGVVTLLSESNRLGPVEGVYVIATDVTEKTVPQLSNVVANLDFAARKLCPSIRYFAVINPGLSVGQQTCLARGQDKLPATLLNIPSLRKLEDDNATNRSALSWRSAVNATERALRSSQTTLLAHSQKVQQQSLLQQIATVADLVIPEEAMDDITLEDMGVEMLKVPAICSFLQDVHNVALPEENIPHLTISKIQELEKISSGFEFKKVKGLETFFSYVDPDELLATAEMVLMPTATNNSSMRDDEFDVTQTYLCIVPGMEGHHKRFEVLCERLKLPALVLQPGLDHLQESPKDTAERYAKLLLKRACLQKHFYLLGYESGVSIALEVAAILEEHGSIGTVFCLGGSPEDVSAVVAEELKDIKTDEELQDAVARHMFGLMSDNVEGLDKELQNASTWDEKVEVCVRLLLGLVPHSAMYARSWMRGAYTRVRQAGAGGAGGARLHSQLVLLRAGGLATPAAPPALQARSSRPLATHQLAETFAHAAKDLRCADIINSYLHPDILEKFEKMNRCETYLLNADTFMTSSA